MGDAIEQMESEECNFTECPVDGNWGSWNAWENCTENCGSGVSNRTRLCNDPLPQFGVANCTGNSTLSEEWNAIVNTTEQTESGACPCINYNYTLKTSTPCVVTASDATTIISGLQHSNMTTDSCKLACKKYRRCKGIRIKVGYL